MEACGLKSKYAPMRYILTLVIITARCVERPVGKGKWVKNRIKSRGGSNQRKTDERYGLRR